MSSVFNRTTGQQLTSDAELRAFLSKEDIFYEHWPETLTPAELRDRTDLTDDEKIAVLQGYDPDIRSLAARQGYRNWDVVVMSERAPDLLRRFGAVHTHLEDEVRVVTGGSCVFVIRRVDGSGYFELETGPGDVVAIPANRPHAFRLTDEGHTFVVRLFAGEIGSVAYPYDDPEFQLVAAL